MAEPFTNLLESRGWVCTKVTSGKFSMDSGNYAFQKCLPDYHVTHIQYGERWIEYKIFDAAWKIHLTAKQMIRFPILMANGTKIWCIAGKDIRGPENYEKRLHLYAKLMDEPNGSYMLNKRLHHMLK